MSDRAKADARLGDRIVMIHAESRKTYGSPRIQHALQGYGVRTSRKRVARLMRERGISAKTPRHFRKTTDSNHPYPVAENVLHREFEAKAPNEKWASDITYIWTMTGWLYFAVVIDLFSRKVVGWALGDSMETELVLSALHMAVESRQPGPSLVHHSDRGSQYAAKDYRKALEAFGAIASMSRKGNCWDNAVPESFFGTLKTELVHRYSWTTMREAKSAIFEYIEVFYNRKRKHSTLGYQSPEQYENEQQMLAKERPLAA